MVKKRKPIVMYFYAPEWDRNAIEKKNRVYDSCKKLGLSCSVVDVETPNGVDLSIRYGVRNVPTAVIVRHGEVIGVEKGNYIQDFLEDYCQSR